MTNMSVRLGSSPRNRVQLDAQRGFTLIEMSIVLVIIGLIIGGIIKGEEVVANARSKSQVAQFDAIKGAIFTFQDKFGSLPGDYTGNTQLSLSASPDGDENGYIAATGETSISDATTAVGTESSTLWLQLSETGLLAGVSTSGTALTSATSATYAGKTGNSYIWVATFKSGWGTTTTMARLQSGTGTPTAIWREIDAYTTDLKFDDGTPSSGDILGAVTGIYNGCTSATPASGTAATYSLGTSSTNALTCVMMYIMQ